LNQFADVAPVQDDGHDFSPEGTLVMPSSDSEVGITTYVGGEEAVEPKPAEQPARDDAMVDFELDLDSPAVQTSVNAVTDSMGTETLVVSHGFDQGSDLDNPKLADTIVDNSALDNPKLADTVVNNSVLDADSLEFDVSLTDSVFLGQPMMSPEFDIGSINLDLAAEPAAAPVAAPAETVAELAPASAAPEVAPSDSPVHDSHWEEVNTKLDLAKAYEEMGDLEGARELLQEVVGEGSVDLVEQARTILGRIGE